MPQRYRPCTRQRAPSRSPSWRSEFDVTPRAIRFYEDVGLLEPARAGRNRVYTQRDRTRLKLTLRGKRLGLALSEIKQLVDMYDSEPTPRRSSTPSWPCWQHRASSSSSARTSRDAGRDRAA